MSPPAQRRLGSRAVFASQYGSRRTEIRIRLRSGGVNAYGWQRWVFDQLDLDPVRARLGTGHGTAELWRENGRVPGSPAPHLTDLRSGCFGRRARRRQPLQTGPLKCANVDGPVLGSEPRTRRRQPHALSRRRQAKGPGEIRRVLAADGVFARRFIGAPRCILKRSPWNW